MESGCPKIARAECRQDYAERVLRQALGEDLALLVVLFALLWGQYFAERLIVALLPAVLGGALLCGAVAIRLPLACVLSLGAAGVGAEGMRLVRPSPAAMAAVAELLAGAPTRRVELELRIEGAVERRAAGAGRARVATRWRGESLLLLATFPELPWSGRGFLAPGDRMRVVGKVRAAAEEGIFSFGELLLRRGMVGSVQVVHVDALALGSAEISAREVLLRRLLERHPLVDGFGVMVAGAFGVGDLLSAEVVELFRETGLTHLLVVSGYHVGVLFTAIYGCAAWGVRLFPALTVVIPMPMLASCISLLLGGAAVGFVGATLTTARAVLSATLVLGAKMFALRVTPRRTLLLVLLMSAGWWPGSAFEAGFQLTFAALFGLYYGGRWGSAVAQRFVCNRERGWGKLVAQLEAAVWASLGATMFTTPIMLCWFNTLSPLALLFNLLAGGVFSLLFILMAGALFFIRACGVAIAEYGIDLLVIVAEYYLVALGWCAAIAARSPFHYREFTPEIAKRVAGSIELVVAVGIGVSERSGLKQQAKVFAIKGLKNSDDYATLPDRQRAI